MAAYQGICTTCNNAPECALMVGPPRIHCDMFDDHVERPDAPAAGGAPNPAASPITVATRREPLELALGLCCNCDNSGDCALVGVEGGIWHCAEYC